MYNQQYVRATTTISSKVWYHRSRFSFQYMFEPLMAYAILVNFKYLTSSIILLLFFLVCNPTTEPVIHNHTMSAATKLRRAIETPGSFVFAPGVYDGLSARTALEVGFDCLYMVRHFNLPLGMESLIQLTADVSLLQTGAGTTASRLGQPDLAIASLPGKMLSVVILMELLMFTPSVRYGISGRHDSKPGSFCALDRRYGYWIRWSHHGC